MNPQVQSLVLQNKKKKCVGLSTGRAIIYGHFVVHYASKWFVLLLFCFVTVTPDPPASTSRVLGCQVWTTTCSYPSCSGLWGVGKLKVNPQEENKQIQRNPGGNTA